MAQLKKGMVKASTLLEVIIAMVIILVIFTLAIGVYNNVLGASPSIKKQQAKAMSDECIARSINEENWNDEQITRDDIILEKKVLPYQSYNDLVVITVTAFQQDKELSRSRQIVKKVRHE
jgi:Tfp pilus assembly protein PilV